MSGKYRVKFRRKVIAWERCDIVVEADSEEEALDIVSNYEKEKYLDEKSLEIGDRIKTLRYDMTDAKVEKTAFYAMFSGGRDSSAMTDLLCDFNAPLDYIIFSDTGAEFDIMYDYIEKFRGRLKEKYDRDITVLGPRTTFEHWVFGTMTKGKQKRKIRGLPKMVDPCFWKRESKIRPVERFSKENGFKNPITYIGYTNSEKDRADVVDPYLRFPLIEHEMCEADVDRYLESIDMVNPLYKLFTRTGCSFCPYMSLQAYYTVYKNYKDVWAYMENIETKLKSMDNVANDQWSILMTMKEMEVEFNKPDHNFSDEPAKACECKI